MSGPEREGGGYTKRDLLRQLRAIERRLYARRAVEEAGKLDDVHKQEFVAARLHLAYMITRLNAQVMREIRERLEAQGAELEQALAVLDDSLRRLEQAPEWAGFLNRILVVLGRVVGFL